MRRRPAINHPRGQDPLNLASPAAQPQPNTPSSAADVIEPFIAEGGGETFYRSGFENEVDVEPGFDAVQLVCQQWVPPGRVAFIKRIEIAPCAPPIFVDPWRGWDATFNLFEAGPDPFGAVQRAPAQAGLWETPLAWEGYAPAEHADDGPEWRWCITLLDGNVASEKEKLGIPAFSVTNPASWMLALNRAVPRSPNYGPLLSGGQQPNLPGRAVPGYVGEQRYQATPTNPLPVHFMVPENSTILLWAYWHQPAYVAGGNPILAFGPNGPLQPWGSAVGLPPIFPLLPSVGRVLGYMQAATREAALENAEFGWGG